MRLICEILYLVRDLLEISDRDTHLCTVTRTYSHVQHTDRGQRLIEFTDNGLRRRINKGFVVQVVLACCWGWCAAFYYNVGLK